MKNLILLFLVMMQLCSISFKSMAIERDLKKESLIEKQLNEINESLVPLFQQATRAMDAGNLKAADSLYSLVNASAPEFDPMLRRLGSIKIQLGQVDEGFKLCQKAVDINRSAYNLLTLANLYVFSEKKDLSLALQLLKEAMKLPEGKEVDFYLLRAQIELQRDDIYAFRNTTRNLLDKYSENPYSHYYAAILAINDGSWKKAYRETKEAEQLGLPQEAVQALMDSGIEENSRKFRYFNGLFLVIGIWLAGLLLLFVFGKILSNITMMSLEQKDASGQFKKLGNTWRNIYKAIINIAGVYYYLSLPIIIILLIGLVAALVYAFLLIGRIPIQITAILVIGTVVSIFWMIRSLFLKTDTTDPGRFLKPEEAPELYNLTKIVASHVGTRPVDEIRITVATDLAVYEKGSWIEKMQDRAKRILIIGTGILKDFKMDEFQSVLAHEYGHFSHRDTAGGNVALRVQNDMNKYFYALYMAGQNVWWNLAFWFLKLYSFLFRRISHGSTRLQEVLADRVAAQNYGTLAFEGGLKHVIRRDIEFNKLANKEIELAMDLKRPFNNLYELTNEAVQSIDEEYTKILERKTTEDDTHPSPVDRFRLINGIKSSQLVSDKRNVTDLFTNWNDLTGEMTKTIEERIKKQF